mmetsp:Transcript_47870/g.104382  ORF Transcript_47870/g.104382 Transcript_47870/m.104382 type:complete len:184 (-) Transcript_47870:77-628(-)
MAAFAPVERRSRSTVSVLACLAALGAICQVYSPAPDFVSGVALRGSARDGRGLVARQGKVDDIVEELKTLTLTEAAELVKAIEETFDVDASASAGAVMMAAPAAGGAEEAAPEKTEFDVVLKEVPKEKKIAVIKALRSITGLGLKEAKGLADNPGKFIEGKPKEVCEDAVKQLEEAGAKAVIE